MEIIIASITAICAFVITVFFTKYWIKVARRAGIIGRDMNKPGKPEISEAGGVAVIMGFTIALLLYIFFDTFYLGSRLGIGLTFALLTSVLLAAFLGFADDILGWKIGLKQWQKPILTIPAAIPLMVINAGVSTLSVPFIGPVEFGIIYPLIIIPIGIIGAANGFNFIAGHNGLEASLGAIIIATLGFVALLGGMGWLFVISMLAVSSLLAFLVFNKYPAKIFPGDSLTYPIGVLIAIIAILGNMEKIAVILFIPYFIEFILKSRSRFRAENFGIPGRGGRLKMPGKKICSLTHVAMIIPEKLFGKRPHEYDVVLTLLIFEIIFVVAVLLTI